MTDASDPNEVSRPSPQQLGHEAPRRKELIKERRWLNDYERSAVSEYDKLLTTLAAGALVLSVNFLRPESGPVPLSLLLSWIAFALSLFCVLLSYPFSRDEVRARRHQIDQELRGLPPTSSPERTWTWTTVFNWSAIGALFLGVVCLIVFAAQGASPMSPKHTPPPPTSVDKALDRLPPPPPSVSPDVPPPKPYGGYDQVPPPPPAAPNKPTKQ